jgi:tripartite-type tricarboxylate transporter receptor subunit TctC
MKAADMFPFHPASLRRQLVLSLTVVLACSGALAPLQASAQSYPNKPIRMVVPFPPGGGFDAIARPLSEKMAALLKQTIIVDNKAGAGGNIGTAEVARAANDGYTILFANEILATNPNVYKSASFDPLKDFEPIAMVATIPLVLAVYPGLPTKNLEELVALSSKEPITFGTPGIGTSPHLFGELLNLKTPLKMRHIPYRGTGPAITDAIGGQTNAVLSTASALTPHITSGKLRGIAILSEKRSSLLPDLPTLAEAGIKGHTHDVWYALMAPAGTPEAIVTQLRDAAMSALRSPELVERLRKQGIEPVLGDGTAVTRLIKTDLLRWGGVVRDANVPRE